MADGRFPCGSQRDGVILDTNRVLDCCRDRDCYENVEVFLSPIGEEIIQNTDSVRIRDAEVVWTSIDVSPIQFNRGFCSVNIRYFHSTVSFPANRRRRDRKKRVAVFRS